MTTFTEIPQNRCGLQVQGVSMIGKPDKELEQIRKRWKAAETGEGYYSRRDGWDAFVEHAHEDIAYLLERLERANQLLYEARNPMLPNGETTTFEEVWADLSAAQQRLEEVAGILQRVVRVLDIEHVYQGLGREIDVWLRGESVVGGK